MKKFISLILAVMLVFTLAVSAYAEPVVKKIVAAEKTDIDEQIDLMFANLSELSQDSVDGSWNYAVTDLDHNGNLELIAGICKAPDYKTYAKIFEVSAERDAFIECDMSVKEGEPFVDIVKNSADTFYDKPSDIWYYMFSDDFTNDNEHYTTKCSICLKDGYVTPKSYATEHCEMIDGFTVVSFMDLDGNEITPEQFNSAGSDIFKDLEKSGTNFSWFTMKDAKTASVLTDSYKVFIGEKEAKNTDKAEENKSKAGESSESPFLMISKNPTSEYHYEGETAYFVAGAKNAAFINWTFISPSGNEYKVQDFENKFIQCKVSGANSGTLSIKNVSADMNGWGAYCTFNGNGQTARSSTAYLNVASKPQPTPVPTYRPVSNTIGGYVSDYLMSSVTIGLNNGTTVQVLKDICTVTGGGHLDYGCACTCYFSGNTPTSANIYYVEVKGASDKPVYNSTSGSYYAAGSDNFAIGIYVPITGTTVYVSPSIVNFSGIPYDGCSCTVYYTGNVPTGNSGGSIYKVDVYGSTAPTPAPVSYWECSQCGYLYNTGSHCDNCGFPIGGLGAGWTCSACGKWNGEYDVYCTGCSTSRYATGLLGDVIY